MFSIGRARHPGPARCKGVPRRSTIEFVNVGGWLAHGDLATTSCAQFLAVAEHRLGLWVISFARLIFIPSGHLLSRITFQVVMLGWVW